MPTKTTLPNAKECSRTRNQLGLSQRDAEELLGIPHGTVSALEIHGEPEKHIEAYRSFLVRVEEAGNAIKQMGTTIHELRMASLQAHGAQIESRAAEIEAIIPQGTELYLPPVETRIAIRKSNNVPLDTIGDICDYTREGIRQKYETTQRQRSTRYAAILMAIEELGPWTWDPSEFLHTQLRHTSLPPRVSHALARHGGIKTWVDVTDLEIGQLLEIPEFGPDSAKTFIDFLARHGIPVGKFGWTATQIANEYKKRSGKEQRNNQRASERVAAFLGER